MGGSSTVGISSLGLPNGFNITDPATGIRKSLAVRFQYDNLPTIIDRFAVDGQTMGFSTIYNDYQIQYAIYGGAGRYIDLTKQLTEYTLRSYNNTTLTLDSSFNRQFTMGIDIAPGVVKTLSMQFYTLQTRSLITVCANDGQTLNLNLIS